MTDVSREVAELRLTEFWKAALLRAGGGTSLAEGARRLSARLGELGFTGQSGTPYNPDSISHWPAGRRLPSAEVLVAVALDLGLSLDFYVHGGQVKTSAEDLAATVAENARLVNLLVNWAADQPGFREMVRMREPDLEQRIAG